MLEALAKRRNDDRGFTLIELMIVVLIIGILLAVGFPTFLGAQRRAQNRAAQALLSTAMTAAKVWYTDGTDYVGFDATVSTVAYANAIAIEPSIKWGTAGNGTVSAVVTAPTAPATTSNEIVLTTVSGSGTTFCMKDTGGTLYYGNSASTGALTGTTASTCGSASAIVSTVQTLGWKTP